jgi:hypothetical protein
MRLVLGALEDFQMRWGWYLDEDLDPDVFDEVIFAWVVFESGVRRFLERLPDVGGNFTIEKQLRSIGYGGSGEGKKRYRGKGRVLRLW